MEMATRKYAPFRRPIDESGFASFICHGTALAARRLLFFPTISPLVPTFLTPTFPKIPIPSLFPPIVPSPSSLFPPLVPSPFSLFPPLVPSPSSLFPPLVPSIKPAIPSLPNIPGFTPTIFPTLPPFFPFPPIQSSPQTAVNP